MADIIHDPVYRLTVYDIDGVTPLSPAAGSVHSDSFQVTTVSGSVGWQPYLDSVKFDYGEADIPKGTYATGKTICRVADFRTGTSNLERWMTAFIGDSEGMNRLIARKALVEESLDGGSTWNTMFYGRITDLSLSDPMVYGLTISDDAVRLSGKIFERTPTSIDDISVSRFCLIPWGFENEVANIIPSVPKWDTSIQEVDGIHRRVFLYNPEDYIPGQDSFKFFSSIGTYLGDIDVVGEDTDSKERNKVEISDSSGNFLGYGLLSAYGVGTAESSNYGALWFGELPQDDPDYYSFAGLTKGTNIQIRVFHIDEETGRDSYYITAPDNFSVLEKILDGHFSTGSLNPDMTYDPTNLLNISSSLEQMPPFVAKIRESHNAQEFIEDHLLKPLMLSYNLESTGTNSVFKVYNLAIPETTSGLTFISGSHLTTNEPIDWNVESPYKFNVTSYFDMVDAERVIGVILDGAGRPEAAINKPLDDIIRTAVSEHPYLHGSIEEEYNSPNELDVDAFCNRMLWYIDATNDTISFTREPNIDLRGHSPFKYVGKKTNIWIGRNYSNRFGVNQATIGLQTRRTDDIEALSIGDWVVLDIEWLPDPATRKRGSPRLAQLVSKNPNKGSMDLQLLDGGLTSSMSAPNVNITANGTHGISIDVQATEDAYHNVEYIILPAGTATVAQNDVRWMFHDTVPISNGNTESVLVEDLPGEHTIYARARAQRPLNGSLKVPSAWTTSTQYDMATLPVPTGLSLTNASAYAVSASWTPAGSYQTEVWTDANADQTPRRYSLEESGSNAVVITGIDQSPVSTNTVYVRHKDKYGGLSAWVSDTFVRGGSTNQAPNLAGIFIYDYRTWG